MRHILWALALMAALPELALASEDDRGRDLSAVTSVRITGDASKIKLTAGDAASYGMTLKTQRKGWFDGWQSGWFYDDCAGASTVKLEGTTLAVAMVSSNWYSLSDCVVDAQISVPQGVDVSIDQSASMLHLEGSFSNLRVSGSALDVSLDGHASRVSLIGSAMRARLSYTRLDNNEQVDISSKALMADLEFGPEAKVHYTVTGEANFVDSRLENRPDGGIKVKIDGSFIRATIR